MRYTRKNLISVGNNIRHKKYIDKENIIPARRRGGSRIKTVTQAMEKGTISCLYVVVLEYYGNYLFNRKLSKENVDIDIFKGNDCWFSSITKYEENIR